MFRRVWRPRRTGIYIGASFFTIPGVCSMLDHVLDLFRGADPTSDWRQRVTLPLVLDLRTGAVNGIRPNAPYKELAVLGRPANPRPVARKSFVYPEMGIVYLVSGERVMGVDVVFQARDVFGELDVAASYEGFAPARLRMVDADGSETYVTTDSTPDQVRARFGQAAEIDQDAEWLGLLYERGAWELEFEFDARRVLSRVTITYKEDRSGGTGDPAG
ncbi:MAG TPA: hypothetical protein VEQ60_09280 [Longimicrobium sp.]|nr:hypothetical protein [Longimicrobium sp.]